MRQWWGGTGGAGGVIVVGSLGGRGVGRVTGTVREKRGLTVFNEPWGTVDESDLGFSTPQKRIEEKAARSWAAEEVVDGREPKTGDSAVPNDREEVIGTGGTVEMRGSGEKVRRFGGFWPPERGEGRGGNWRGSGGSGGSGWGGEWLRLPAGVGAEEDKEGIVDKVVNLCSFDTLKNLESNQGEKNMEIRPSSFANSAFFRKGEIGDWQNYLIPEMAARIDGLMVEKLKGSGLLEWKGEVGDWQNYPTLEMAARIDGLVVEKLKGSGLLEW
ncbi:hypothetical protein YC2023_106690 [Brassica napus]